MCVLCTDSMSVPALTRLCILTVFPVLSLFTYLAESHPDHSAGAVRVWALDIPNPSLIAHSQSIGRLVASSPIILTAVARRRSRQKNESGCGCVFFVDGDWIHRSEVCHTLGLAAGTVVGLECKNRHCVEC